MVFKLLLLWAFILIGRPQDLLIFLQPLRPALLLTALTLGAIFFTGHGQKFSAVFSMAETKRYLLFYFIMILGIPFAYHRGIAFEAVLIKYLPNILFYLVLITEVDSLKKLKSLILVICFSILLLNFFGYMYGISVEGRFRIIGSPFDPNDIAYLLVSLCPLALFYLQLNQGILIRLFGGIVFSSSLALILLTGSRGGLVALGAVFIVMLLTKIGGMKKSNKMVFIGFSVAILFLLGDKINLERYLSLTEIGSDYNISDEFGRMKIWEFGFAMIIGNPITGVGVDCFAMAIGYMRENMGLIPRWQVAHNSFLQIASEVGLFGFIVFFVIIVRSLTTFLRASKIADSNHEANEIRVLGGLTFLSFLGHLIAANFLTQGYSIYFTLFFALAAIIQRIQADHVTSVASNFLTPIKTSMALSGRYQNFGK